MSKFGTLMKALRKQEGLTLEKVARRIGSHKGYVSGIENDKVNAPSSKVVAKFHKCFEVACTRQGATLEDLVELAWADKAPALIRNRVHRRLAEYNPLFGAKSLQAQPALTPAPEPSPAAVKVG